MKKAPANRCFYFYSVEFGFGCGRKNAFCHVYIALHMLRVGRITERRRANGAYRFFKLLDFFFQQAYFLSNFFHFCVQL